MYILVIRMEVASSRPDYIPTLSTGIPAEHSLLVKHHILAIDEASYQQQQHVYFGLIFIINRDNHRNIPSLAMFVKHFVFLLLCRQTDNTVLNPGIFPKLRLARLTATI